MARYERDASRRAMFEKMAAMEMKHAAHWAAVLGVDASRLRPARAAPGLLAFAALARLFGPARLIPLLVRGESSGAKTYLETPEAAALVSDERDHQMTLRHMAGGKDGGSPHPESGFLRGDGGTLRAAVLGINDGLVSNFSLVMGVAGGTGEARFIILAGIAGLLAGAFSMAAGEYISMRSQRDVYEHLIETERAEIEQWPEEEEKELSFIYQRKGLTRQEADLVAGRLMQDRKIALETKVREELGLDPDDLGSPWAAAFSSMMAFLTGAIVPILPFLFGAEGTAAVVVSAVTSATALAAVGGGLAWFSGISAIWGATRMALVGGAAAAVTYGVGNAIGASVNG
jgi:VIT1/CCC1 family predicted Fe2+/Mn2+ transporter